MSDIISRLRNNYEYGEEGDYGETHIPNICLEAADEIERLRAEVERLQEEKAVAIKLLSDASRAQGVAEGKLAGSEIAGVVEGWRERAKRAEKEVDMLRDLLYEL